MREEPGSMDTYRQVSRTALAAHSGLVAWSRALMRAAGLEAVEVYGRFPADGITSSYLVVFPYRLGPDPVIADYSRPANLLGVGDGGRGRSGAPGGWQALGGALERGLMEALPGAFRRGRAGAAPVPRVLLGELPEALQGWYREQPSEAGWIGGEGAEAAALLPSLVWRAGLQVTVFYVAIASDGGRGVNERTSVGPPAALGALSVLTSGIHLERSFETTLPSVTPPPALRGFAEALAASAPDAAGGLRGALDRLDNPEPSEIAIQPMHDLGHQEFSALMQALQRPLQACLNLKISLTLAATPGFEPAALVRIHAGPRGRST